MFLAGETRRLPDVQMSVDALVDAKVALATPEVSLPPLASLLASVRDKFHDGIETIEDKSVETTVAIPGSDTVETDQFVHAGGWDDTTLDPVGWTLRSRLLDCETFVPASASDDQYARVGSAWLVGRLPSGETYPARTTGHRPSTRDVQRLRLRTTMHAAANDGHAIEEVRRAADFPNDEES